MLNRVMYQARCECVRNVLNMHSFVQVHGFYNWPRIAARTEKVYEAAVTAWRDDTLMGRFCRYYQCGTWFGKICCCVAAVMHLYWRWLEVMYPRDAIDIAVSLRRQ